jgi:hypothetical protein
VSDTLIVEYVGFKARPLVREYTFNVREVAMEPREYTLTILNEAFDSHRARYQDAPDICSLRLRRELAANANHLPKTHYRISDAELEDYRSTHGPKPVRTPYSPKAARQL